MKRFLQGFVVLLPIIAMLGLGVFFSARPDTIKATNLQYGASGGQYGIMSLYVSSSTHPDQNTWYSNNSPAFDWFGGSQLKMATMEQYGWPLDIAIAGNYAYLADYAPLQIVDISNPGNPSLAGSCFTSTIGNQVEVSGDHAYVTSLSASDQYDRGLQVFDVSDPASPELVGSYHTPGNPSGVATSGDYAYVLDDVTGMYIIDISNPADPVLVGSYVMHDGSTGNARSVVVRGNNAYVAYGYLGLQIIDVTDPANPVRTGFYDTPGYTTDVALGGDYAYLADSYMPLQIVDISNPAKPFHAGSFNPGTYNYGVDVNGNLAYATLYGGLDIIDVSNPATPTLTYFCDLGERTWTWGVTASGDYAYTGIMSGLQIIDVGPLQVSYVLDHSPDTVPDAVPDTGGSATAASRFSVASFGGSANNPQTGSHSVSFTGLSDGEYYFHAAVTDGNHTGEVSHRKVRINSYSCGQKPSLGLGNARPYWASYADYLSGNLSVRYSLSNSGVSAAQNVAITGVDATAGVTISTAMPLLAGNMAGGESRDITLGFHIPSGTAAFSTRLHGYAEDLCSEAYLYGN